MYSLVQEQCPWGVFQINTLPKWSKPTGEQKYEHVLSKVFNFIKFIFMHRYVLKICCTSREHHLAGEHLWETACVCQWNFKRLKKVSCNNNFLKDIIHKIINNKEIY